MTDLHLEFGGGLEALFSGQKRMAVHVPPSVTTLRDLVSWVKTQLIRERHDMFASGNDIRPGVLVLVNDVDWELQGAHTYEMKSNDRISFISTLHGG